MLYEHHVVHDLIQSHVLGEFHFYGYKVEESLNMANFWPSGWFDLWDIYYDLLGKHAKSLPKDHPNQIKALRENRTFESSSRGGKTSGRMAVEKKTGIHGMTEEEKFARNSAAGKRLRELGKGIFGLTFEQRSATSRKNGRAVCSQDRTHPINRSGSQRSITLDRLHSGVVAHNRANGWDPKARRRIK